MRKWMFLFCAVFVGAGCFAVEIDAVVKELQGKVEVKTPGSPWKAAQKGMILNQNDAISTSFKSGALLEIGKSVLLVKALTRLTVDEILVNEYGESVYIDLQAGRLHAKVEPPPEGKIEFEVRSPQAVAGVRGTEFDFDVLNLAVQRGAVEYRPAGNSAVICVNSGRTVAFDANGSPAGTVASEQWDAVQTGGVQEPVFDSPPAAPVVGGTDGGFFTPGALGVPGGMGGGGANPGAGIEIKW